MSVLAEQPIRRVAAKRRAASTLAGARRRRATVGPADGNYLAGLIDGEGCFLISGSGKGYVPRFTLKLRDDDAPLIREIIELTGIGILTWHENRSERHRGRPCVEWRVGSRHDVRALVEMLDRYPLRSKKARDLTLWREAVFVREEIVAQDVRDWRPMARLKRRLENGRRYRGRR